MGQRSRVCVKIPCLTILGDSLTQIIIRPPGPRIRVNYDPGVVRVQCIPETWGTRNTCSLTRVGFEPTTYVITFENHARKSVTQYAKWDNVAQCWCPREVGPLEILPPQGTRKGAEGGCFENWRCHKFALFETESPGTLGVDFAKSQLRTSPIGDIKNAWLVLS